jgi:membrane-bound lytic murein transglycosylase B
MRRVKGLPALALLLLAACGGTAPAPSATANPADPAIAECREEARNSPEVRELWREANMNTPTQRERMRQRRSEVETRVYGDCIRRRGLVRGGGVEPVRRPSGSLF